MKSSFEVSFSINIENDFVQEDVKKCIDKEKNEFNYIEFLDIQREKIYEGSSDENSLAFSETMSLFINFFNEIEMNKTMNDKFIEKIYKDNSIFNYLRYFSKK